MPDAKAAPLVETAWLFLKGLGREAVEKPETLRNVFTQWGAGDSATLIIDPATQTRRGTAIVQMQGTEQVPSCMPTILAGKLTGRTHSEAHVGSLLGA